jgi:hypothetical protein
MKSTKPSETFALKLLKEHLTTQGESGCQCEINKNEPPDLIITWDCGERWGVEVTHAYQQVEQIGKPGTVSSESIFAFLQKFAEELEEEFKPICRRNYLLFLEGPGLFSSWKIPVPLKQWKKETEARIRKHIESDARDVLRFCGGVLRPGGEGARWTNMFGPPPTEIASATTAMLRRALEDKAGDLPRWKGEFTQRWLLLLNCWPLVESTTELEEELRRSGNKPANTHRFDGILWSGFPDRTLIPIFLTTKR